MNTMGPEGILDYRIARLRDRLALEEAAELGVHIETHGTRAVVRGAVADEEARALVLHLAGEELAGLDWYEDLTLYRSRPPDHIEELS
ncbi:hypothetical protein [Streptomyces sp. NPDC048603]|uniref:hypothetical protein n=1 Tax=Streptomyces sp. NPDC048603 TaxID=3365577 RepID=UPI00371E8EEC